MGNHSSKQNAKKPLGINPNTVSTLSTYLHSRRGAAVEYRYLIGKRSYGGLLISQNQLEDLVKKVEGYKIKEFMYKFMVVDAEWLWPFPVNVKGQGEFKSAF